MKRQELPDVLTPEQAAAFLQLPLEEVIRELENGMIPAWCFSYGWRISKIVLERLLEGQFIIPKKTDNQSSPPNVLQNSLSTQEEISESLVFLDSQSQQSNQQDHNPDTNVVTPSKKHDSLLDSDSIDTIEVKKNSPIEISSGALPPVPEGREYAKTISYNPQLGHGRAYLIANNKYIFLDSRNLMDDAYHPLPGDIIEVTVGNKKRGPEGLAIILISRNNKWMADKSTFKSVDRSSSLDEQISKRLPASSPSTTERTIERSSPPKNESKSPIPILTNSQPWRVNKPPFGGTAKSNELFQRAAVAQVNGRIPEAKRLLREAIQAGAGANVYTAYFKMELKTGSRDEARRIMNEAIDLFPNHATFYEMYGQMERRARNFDAAEEIFRSGLTHSPEHASLQWGLAQTLVEAGTDEGLREAGEIFARLDRRKKLHRDDRVYQRFIALQSNPRANRAYDFFKNGGMRVGITGRRDLPWYITDIVVETSSQELNESFGLSGGFLVRCFRKDPEQIDIQHLKEYLEGISMRPVVGVQDGREVWLNSNVAFIAVPNIDSVDGLVMAVLGEGMESIVPLDDTFLTGDRAPLIVLQEMLTRYLARRDLYNSTQPVHGRRFFGREKDMRELMDQVHRGQFVGIYGLRKMGKTSLIYQLRNEKLTRALVAYLDLLQNDAPNVGHCGPIYWQLERLFYERLIEDSSAAAELLRLGKIARYTDIPSNLTQYHVIFSEDLRSLLDGIVTGGYPDIGRIVIVLDELERILPVGDSKGVDGYLQLFGLLRGLAQMPRYEGLLSSVVVAANAAVSEAGYWGKLENPVFGLYQPHYLKPLLPKEFSQMIVTLGKGMSVYWEEDAVEEVFIETGGHPLLGRLLCSRITKAPKKPLTVTRIMVQEAIPTFIRDDGDKLEQIIALLHVNFPAEEELLKQIALERLEPDLQDDSLRHLLGYHLVSIEEGKYRITINMLRRWLRRRGGIRE